MKVYWMILFIGYVHPDKYRLATSLKSLNDSRNECICYGMDLAVINDNDVMKEVREYIAKVDSLYADIWIGLIWSGRHKKFFWLNNDDRILSWPVGDPPWSNQEPNCMKIPCQFPKFKIPQKCVRMSKPSLEWKTYACNENFLAICQNLTSITRNVSSTSEPVKTNCVTADKLSTSDSTTTTDSVTINVFTTITSNTNSLPTASKSTVANISQESTKRQSQNELTTESITTKLSTNAKSTTESTKLPVIVTTELITLNMESSFKTSTELTTNGAFFNNCTRKCPCKSVSNEVNTPIENYRIDKRQTSAYIRRHSSAYDGRLSSRIIGYTGAAVICTIVLIVISFDIINLLKRNEANK